MAEDCVIGSEGMRWSSRLEFSLSNYCGQAVFLVAKSELS